VGKRSSCPDQDHHGHRQLERPTSSNCAPQPDAKEAVAKTEIRISRAIAPGEITLYFGYIRIGSTNSIAARTHSVRLTVNPWLKWKNIVELTPASGEAEPRVIVFDPLLSSSSRSLRQL